VKFGIRDLHILLFVISEFHANRRPQGRTLVQALSQVLQSRVYRETLRRFESTERLGEYARCVTDCCVFSGVLFPHALLSFRQWTCSMGAASPSLSLKERATLQSM
jgi:hypothetical protein